MLQELVMPVLSLLSLVVSQLISIQELRVSLSQTEHIKPALYIGREWAETIKQSYLSESAPVNQQQRYAEDMAFQEILMNCLPRVCNWG